MAKEKVSKILERVRRDNRLEDGFVVYPPIKPTVKHSCQRPGQWLIMSYGQPCHGTTFLRAVKELEKFWGRRKP